MGIIQHGLKTAKQVRLWSKFLVAKSSITKDKAQIALLQSLSTDKGLSLKIAQLLSNGQNNSALRDIVHSTSSTHVAWDEVEPLLREELGALYEEKINSVEPKGFSASLGQVHKAKLLSGETVAIKFLYPGIQQEIHSQSQILGLLPNIGPAKKWGVDISGYKKQIQQLLESELDTLKEQQTNQKIFQMFQNHNSIQTPQVLPELSGSWFFTQTWLDGESCFQIESLNRDEKRQLADLLLQFTTTLLFKGHCIQSDFHRGNFYWKRCGNQIHLQAFDFGAVLNVSENMIQGLVDLIYHGSTSSSADPISLLSGVGFDSKKLQHIAPACGEIVRLICEPFVEPRRYHPKHWQLFSRMKMALGEDHWWFRSAGSPEFLMLMRSLQGLLSLLVELDSAVEFLNTIRQFAADRWTTAQNKTIPNTTLNPPPLSALSQRLHVRVVEGNNEIVNLSLAISSIYELESLIQPEVQEKISQQNIDIENLVRQFVKKGALPGPLFQANYENKTLTVWAE